MSLLLLALLGATPPLAALVARARRRRDPWRQLRANRVARHHLAAAVARCQTPGA